VRPHAGNGRGPRHYTRAIDVLTVCTANMCRSPLLEVLLGSALRARGVDAHVHSAGTMADGRGAVPEMVDLAAERGLDLTSHLGRRLDPDLVRGADVVLPLAREHLREVVVTSPEAFGRTFTPKELVRRAAGVGGRRPGEPLEAFLARAHEGRTAQQLLRSDPADDVADPIGGPRSGYERTASELDGLAAALAVLLAPLPAPDTASPAPRPDRSLSPLQET
jgi:protein-tyrosine phosphatase